MTKVQRRVALLSSIAASIASPLRAQSRVELFRRTIHDGIDPRVPPRSTIVVKNDGIFGFPSPRVKLKYRRVRAVLIVEGPNQQDVISAARQCAERAIVAGVVAAVVAAYFTGGSAAVQAGIASTIADLTTCVSQTANRIVEISGKVDMREYWEGDDPYDEPNTQPLLAAKAEQFRLRLDVTNVAVNHLLLN